MRWSSARGSPASPCPSRSTCGRRTRTGAATATPTRTSAHAAAAIIAWTGSRRTGTALPKADGTLPSRTDQPTPVATAPARVGYRLTRDRNGFTAARVLVRMGRDEEFHGTLLGQARTGAGALLSTEADLDAEEAMARKFGGVVPRERVPRLLKALERCRDVTLDGDAIPVSGDPVLPVARVEDDPDANNPAGFRVRVVRDPGISEAFRNAAVICGGQLRPTGNGGLTPRQRQVYYQRSGVCFQLDEVESLVAEVILALRKRIPVDVRTTRLPEEREPLAARDPAGRRRPRGQAGHRLRRSAHRPGGAGGAEGDRRPGPGARPARRGPPAAAGPQRA